MPSEAEELVNEGIYGNAFAEPVEKNLKQRGYEIPFTCCKDW